MSDASGAVLPGATVTLEEYRDEFHARAGDRRDGRFRGLLLPLGPYKLTVALDRLRHLRQEGIELVVGQTGEHPDRAAGRRRRGEDYGHGRLARRRDDAGRGVDADQPAGARGLPNNGRNFLGFTQLTPGVKIVQGPDGDELSVNGQKGITNNISVDGADFNNPFFGEQRGGQRPAFTFNQDAVKEIVVVADGAAPEFGRSGSGFVNVVTKSGTNTIAGSAHFFYKHDALLPRKTPASEKFPLISRVRRHAAAARSRRISCSTSWLTTSSSSTSRNSSTRPRIEPRIVDFMRPSGSPNENRSIRLDSTTRGSSSARWTDHCQLGEPARRSRYNYTWMEHRTALRRRLVGTQRQRVERDFDAVSGSLVSSLSSTLLNEFRLVAERIGRGPTTAPTSRARRPFPDTGIVFAGYRFGLPFFIPVDYYDTRVQFVDNLSLDQGATHDQG